MKNVLKNLIALFIGCIAALFLVEVFLRFYNPVESRVKGTKIILPVNKKYITENHTIQSLERKIVHTKNSLGFRGKEPSLQFSKHLTLITIGGSTTECKYLSDGKTWTDVLGQNLSEDFDLVWINNAGLDGHSTFGHMILMEDYISNLKPKLALFFVGVNDMGRGDIGAFELQHIRDRIEVTSIRGFIKSLSSYSETFALILNLYRHYRAETMGLSHRGIDLKKVEMVNSPAITQGLAKREMEESIKHYEMRLSRLINITKESHIDPVLITQPALYGGGIDDLTGVDLARMRVGNMDGKGSWDLTSTVFLSTTFGESP